MDYFFVFVSQIKDILLVMAGAFATYLAQKWLFNDQYKKELKQKEESIILEAVRFLQYWDDQILAMETMEAQKRSDRLTQIMDKGFFQKMGIISFQLKRLDDSTIWQGFEKACNSSHALFDQIYNFKGNSDEVEKARKHRNEMRREFVDTCIKQIKINK